MTILAHNPTTDERGFTLLELIIYIGLISIVLGAAVMFVLQFTITQTKARTGAQAAKNAQFAMERIAIEARGADSVNVGASVFGTNPGTLTLVTANGATNPTVFTVTNGQLMVQQGAGSPVALTQPDASVTEFTLENLVPHGRSQHVRVHLKVTLPPSSGFSDVDASAEIDTTIRIRRNDNFTLLYPYAPIL